MHGFTNNIHYIIHYNVKGGQQLPFFLLAPVPPVQPSMLLAFFVVAAHGWLTFHGAFFSRAVTKLASSLYPHVRLFTPGTELWPWQIHLQVLLLFFSHIRFSSSSPLSCHSRASIANSQLNSFALPKRWWKCSKPGKELSYTFKCLWTLL